MHLHINFTPPDDKQRQRRRRRRQLGPFSHKANIIRFRFFGSPKGVASLPSTASFAATFCGRPQDASCASFRFRTRHGDAAEDEDEDEVAQHWLRLRLGYKSATRCCLFVLATTFQRIYFPFSYSSFCSRSLSPYACLFLSLSFIAFLGSSMNAFAGAICTRAASALPFLLPLPHSPSSIFFST